MLLPFDTVAVLEVGRVVRYLARAPDSEMEGRKRPRSLLRKEMERAPGGSRGGRPQPGPCPLQPARHSLNPIYSW